MDIFPDYHQKLALLGLSSDEELHTAFAQHVSKHGLDHSRLADAKKHTAEVLANSFSVPAQNPSEQSVVSNLLDFITKASSHLNPKQQAYVKDELRKAGCHVHSTHRKLPESYVAKATVQPDVETTTAARERRRLIFLMQQEDRLLRDERLRKQMEFPEYYVTPLGLAALEVYHPMVGVQMATNEHGTWLYGQYEFEDRRYLYTWNIDTGQQGDDDITDEFEHA